MLVTFLLPCLNEESSIGLTIDEVPRTDLENAGFAVEILVVDGQSEDSSVEIAKKRGARVVECSRGYGLQYRRGFECALGEIIVAADSDCTYPIGDSLNYLKILESGCYDFISVNRFANRLPLTMPTINVTGNLALTKITNMLFGLSLMDSQSGMWIFKKEPIAKLRLTSDGMALSQEIKIEAFTKLRSKEVPGNYRARIGKPKLSIIRDGAKNLAFLLERRKKEYF